MTADPMVSRFFFSFNTNESSKMLISIVNSFSRFQRNVCMKSIKPNKALNYRIFQRKLKGRSSLILNFMNNELKLEKKATKEER